VIPTLVDSNVLLDVLDEDETWQAWSESAVARCAQEGDLCLNPIIYAEVSVNFATIAEVELALPEEDFRVAPHSGRGRLSRRESLRFNTGEPVVCAPRPPDFFIGAHAAVLGMRLLTRDPRRYRTYFPTVGLIAP